MAAKKKATTKPTAGTLSGIVRKRLRLRRTRARGNCYGNASHALFELADQMPELKGAVYCEGFVPHPKLPLCPIEHGWLELPDGTVCDPTLPEATGHVALARYTSKKLGKAIAKTGRWPVTDAAKFRKWLTAYWAARGVTGRAAKGKTPD